MLGFEPRISRVLGERHNQARPHEQASNEGRTRDLALTKRMLCQLSYRGGRRAAGVGHTTGQHAFGWPRVWKSKAGCACGLVGYDARFTRERSRVQVPACIFCFLFSDQGDGSHSDVARGDGDAPVVQ